jgi:hypothetical protein
VELSRSFEVDQPADAVASIAASDETLARLFEGTKTEIIERDGNCRTVQTHYTALGRDGVATFQFLFCEEGTIQFEKVCDGNVWRKLEGVVSFTSVRKGKPEEGNPGENRLREGTRVTLHLSGSTKTLVPELAIRGPMKEQLDQMTKSLRKCIEDAGDH